MRLKIQIILGLLFSTVLLTACGNWHYSMLGGYAKEVKDQHNKIIFDCNRQALYPISAEKFWQENNLPKGTTEFTCIDGKAYLKGEEPK